MKINNKDVIYRTVLILEFFLLAFGCFIIYILYREQLIFFFLFLNASTSVYIYSLLRYKHSKKAQSRAAQLVLAINSITKDGEENIYVVNNDDEMHDVYSAIGYVKDSLKKKEKTQEELRNIVNSVAVNMELEKLLTDLMPKLIEATKSNCGAFYLTNYVSGKLEIKHSLGFSKNIYSEFDLTLGEGFIGSVVVNKEVEILNDIPDDTVYIIRTFLGKIKPKSIMVIPVINQEQIAGVLVFASVYNYSQEQLEMVNSIKYYVGVAVGNGITYEKTKRLTNELKFQNRLIQNLNEDLEKKVQERTHFLNDIIDSIKDYAIYATDRNGTVVAWNKGAENVYGYNAQEIMGKNISLIHTQEELKEDKLKNTIDVIMREGKCVEKGWRTKKNGSVYYAEISSFARYSKDGELIGFTNVTKDITEIKNMENELWLEKEFSSRLVSKSAKAFIFSYIEGFIELCNKSAE